MTLIPTNRLYTIIDRLTLVPDSAHPDLQVRPLCPTSAAGELLLSPFLITTSNWLVCSLRNEASDPANYGRVIGPLKVGFADEVAERFSSEGYVAVARRKIFNPATKTELGDADVVVLDKATKSIYILETKWLLEPDSPKEGRAVDEEIQKGRNQLLKIQNFCREHPCSFLRQVFGGTQGDLDGPLSVEGFMVVKGAIGATSLSEQPYVIGYSQLVKQLQQPLQTISNIWKGVLKLQKQPLAQMPPSSLIKVSLGGYHIYSPGRRLATDQRSQKMGRNARCRCGSGSKFKKCCGQYPYKADSGN